MTALSSMISIEYGKVCSLAVALLDDALLADGDTIG